MYENNERNSNQTMDWNDVLEHDDRPHVTLNEGYYNFTVTGFERSRFPGSEKTPPCGKAVVTVGVETPEGPASARIDLLLCRSLEWKLSAFFRCIGQKKPGERLAMNWDAVTGSRGRAHFKPRLYTDRNGEARLANDVDAFLDYDPAFFAGETAAGAARPASGEEALPW